MVIWEEEEFGFRKGKGTRDAIGLIRAIGERYIEKDKDVYAVFVDLEKSISQGPLEETNGDPEENWCGLEGEEALK